MVSTDSQKPLCPVCNQADQVESLQAAYESGMQRFTPPPMPVQQVPMMKYMATGIFIVALCAFFIIVLLAPNLPDWARIIQVVLTILCIIAVLGLSFFAFLRIVQGDQQSQKLLPAWDKAMANWSRLEFCKRDNVVFDPQQNKVLSDQAVNALLTVSPPSDHSAETAPRVAQSA